MRKRRVSRLSAKVCCRINSRSLIAEMKTQQPAAALTRRLLTAAQAGEYIGRTETAIRQMIYKKQLPVVRIGGTVRIDVLDLDEVINNGRM